MYFPPGTDEKLLEALVEFSGSTEEEILTWVFNETGEKRKGKKLTFATRAILLKIWQIYVCDSMSLSTFINDMKKVWKYILDKLSI